MKAAPGLAALALLATSASACPQCRPIVQSNIYNGLFAHNLALMALPLLVVLVLAIAIHFSDEIAQRLREARS